MMINWSDLEQQADVNINCMIKGKADKTSSRCFPWCLQNISVLGQNIIQALFSLSSFTLVLLGFIDYHWLEIYILLVIILTEPVMQNDHSK